MHEKWVVGQRLTVGEVLEMVPSCKPTLAALLDVLSPIPARYYSVASSPLVCPTKLTVAFSVVEYTLALVGEGGREGGVVKRKGLCTTWLEEMLREATAAGGASGNNIQDLHLSPSSSSSSALPSVSLFLKPAKEFVLPGSAKWPLVLVGPGTGVAPFMGFLAHRRARRAAIESARAEVCSGYWRGGFEVEGGEEEGGMGGWAQKDGEGPILLFFGCRTREKDWIYREEMEDFLRQGMLTEMHTAFSREAGKKVYVQDRMREQGARLARLLLKEGAYLYVCGDAENMARDVHANLKALLVQHGQGQPGKQGQEQGGVRTEEEAEAFLSELKQRQRYVLDIWS